MKLTKIFLKKVQITLINLDNSMLWNGKKKSFWIAKETKEFLKNFKGAKNVSRHCLGQNLVFWWILGWGLGFKSSRVK